MYQLVKKYEFIIYILIGSFIGMPVQALARTQVVRQVAAAPYSDLDPKYQDAPAAKTTEAKAPKTAEVPDSDSQTQDSSSAKASGDVANVNDQASFAKATEAKVPVAKRGEPDLKPRLQPVVRGIAKPGTVRVVVIELDDGQVSPKDIEKVTDTLRDELSSEPGFTVVSKERTRAFFSANPDLMQRIDVANPLNRYLDEARNFYKDSYFKEAIGVLSNTIDTYRSAQPAMTESFLLVDAYIYLGNVYMGNNDKKDAKKVFAEAVRLDPEREITQAKFPPKTVQKFVEAKQDMLSTAKSAKVDILTNPKKAEVYVNGVHKGIAPIKINGLPQGDHFILVKKAGYKPMAKKISVKTNYSRVKIDLVKDAQTLADTKGLRVSSLKNVDEQVRMAGKVGNQMGVDKVVLVSMEEVGYNNKITARMIDMQYYASHKPKFVEVLDLPKDTRPAAAHLAKELNEQSKVNLSKNPRKYADSDVLVIGKKKKKSFLKSPLLWTLLGVLVAGGATAGILMATGSGGSGDSNSTTVSVGGSTGVGTIRFGGK